MDLLPSIPEGDPTDVNAPRSKPGITVRFESEDEIATWKLLAKAYDEMDAARGQKRKRKWSASSVLKLAADVYLADVKKRFGFWPKSEAEWASFLAEVRKRAAQEMVQTKKRRK